MINPNLLEAKANADEPEVFSLSDYNDPSKFPIVRKEGLYSEYKGKVNTTYKDVLFFATDRKKLYYNGVDYTSGVVDLSPYFGDRTFVTDVDIDICNIRITKDKPSVIPNAGEYDYYVAFQAQAVIRTELPKSSSPKTVSDNLKFQINVLCNNYAEGNSNREGLAVKLHDAKAYRREGLIFWDYYYGIAQKDDLMNWEIQAMLNNDSYATADIGAYGECPTSNTCCKEFTTVKEVKGTLPQTYVVDRVPDAVAIEEDVPVGVFFAVRIPEYSGKIFKLGDVIALRNDSSLTQPLEIKLDTPVHSFDGTLNPWFLQGTAIMNNRKIVAQVSTGYETYKDPFIEIYSLYFYSTAWDECAPLRLHVENGVVVAGDYVHNKLPYGEHKVLAVIDDGQGCYLASVSYRCFPPSYKEYHNLNGYPFEKYKDHIYITDVVAAENLKMPGQFKTFALNCSFDFPTYPDYSYSNGVAGRFGPLKLENVKGVASEIFNGVLDLGRVDMSGFKSGGSDMYIPIKNIWNLTKEEYLERCREIFSNTQNIRFTNEYGYKVYSMAIESVECMNGILYIKSLIMPDITFSSSNGRSDTYCNGSAGLAFIENIESMFGGDTSQMFEGYDPEIPLYVLISYSKEHESAGYSLRSNSRSGLLNKLVSNLKS